MIYLFLSIVKFLYFFAKRNHDTRAKLLSPSSLSLSFHHPHSLMVLFIPTVFAKRSCVSCLPFPSIPILAPEQSGRVASRRHPPRVFPLKLESRGRSSSLALWYQPNKDATARRYGDKPKEGFSSRELFSLYFPSPPAFRRANSAIVSTKKKRGEREEEKRIFTFHSCMRLRVTFSFLLKSFSWKNSERDGGKTVMARLFPSQPSSRGSVLSFKIAKS